MPLLNTANKLYLGSQAVDAVYAGSTKVWPATTEYNGWGSSVPAGIVAVNPDVASVNLGIAVKTTLSGQVLKGIRFYLQSGESASGVVGAVYSGVSGGYPTGSPLAQVNFAPITGANAWAEARFATPVSLTANQTYFLVAWTPGIYVKLQSYFGSTDIAAPSGAAGLYLLGDTSTAHNGSYYYNDGLAPTTGTYSSSWYGVDGIFD